MSHLVIDTDAGVDDLLAIAYLVTQQSGVTIDAITVVNGLAHVDAGSHNILRLLQVANRQDIPVYKGACTHLSGGTDFLTPWRVTADTLPGVTLPSTSAQPKADAVTYLAQRFADPSNPFTLLALGPHTNLALTLRQTKRSFAGVSQMIMMGGAVFVPGNVDPGFNTKAEWNMFEDPQAAHAVFTAGLPISMVPLDATNQVPITQAFLEEASKLTSPLGIVVSQLLHLGFTSNNGKYFAWDPLAGMSVVVPSVVSNVTLNIEVVPPSPSLLQNAGWTKPVQSGGNTETVATGANATLFETTFLAAFA